MATLPDAESLVIDRARITDLRSIVEIENASYPTPWSSRALETEVRGVRPHSHVLVARLGDRVVGFAMFWAVADEAHILNFAVHPEHRRRGIGKRMMRVLLDEAVALKLNRATLEVRVTNDAAIRLYESVGFEIVAVQRRYYQDTGEDAYVMWIRGLSKPTCRTAVRFWRR